MPTRSGKKFTPSQEVPALSKENEHEWLSYVELVDLSIVLESLIDKVACEGHDESKELEFLCDRQNEIQTILLRLSSSTVVPKDECDNVVQRTIGCVLTDLKKALPLNNERKNLLELETFMERFVLMILEVCRESTEVYPPTGHPIRKISRQVKEKQIRLFYAAMDDDSRAIQMIDCHFIEDLEASMMQFFFGSGYVPERKGKERIWTKRSECFERLASNILLNMEKDIEKFNDDLYLLQYYAELFKLATQLGRNFKLFPSKKLELKFTEEKFKKILLTFPMIWDHEHAPAA